MNPSDHRSRIAADEIAGAVGAVSAEDREALLDALLDARRIACAGVGREGLMMRALAMRLFHLGLDAHVVGEMTTPALGRGDLLLVSAGPGDFGTIRALVEVAREADAATLALTAQPDGAVPALCDTVVAIPAQTMADDAPDAATSVLPMGSLYEGALFLLCELVVLDLRERLEITPEAMRARHTNLE